MQVKKYRLTENLVLLIEVLLKEYFHLLTTIWGIIFLT